MYPSIFKANNAFQSTFFLMAGPCVIENETMPMEIAKEIKAIANKLRIPFIFKASYRKANRSRLDSFTGIGDQRGLEILGEIRKKLDIPVVTDIHSAEEANIAAQYVDVLQIPAFLCRQTDLLVAAAKTGKIINIKKGQFLSAESMRFVMDKVIASGNPNVMLTERGNMFGYGDLVVDYRNIPKMQKWNIPILLDVTHSLQKPNRKEGVTGGEPEMIRTIARAGIAVGVDGIFVETHPDPRQAKSDGANMLRLDLLENLLVELLTVNSPSGEAGE
jgi:2-dehydro-3-deoxyphosphooctonate aldolase (KDO 8-P synthase)